jgi:amidase
VRTFTQTCKLEEYPSRNTAWWDDDIALGFDNADYRFWQAYQITSRLGAELGVTGALEAYNLDVLVLPTAYAPFQSAIAGLPVVTVPMGFYPEDTPVVETENRDLVRVGPNIP